jgi:hypothetical protein
MLPLLLLLLLQPSRAPCHAPQYNAVFPSLLLLLLLPPLLLLLLLLLLVTFFLKSIDSR